MSFYDNLIYHKKLNYDKKLNLYNTVYKDISYIINYIQKSNGEHFI